MNIYKIVLTGGPCAGKTTIIKAINDKLKNRGYYVVVVPETASELICNGILPNGDRDHTLKYQEFILLTQSTKEKIAEDYCENIKNSNLDLIDDKKGIVILYDRAIMDNRAYLSHLDYNNMLKKYGYNEIGTIDKYDLVIDLVSTATAKPEAYQLNGIRYEDVKAAARLDELTSGAWLLHRNLRVIKPTDSIEEKINIVFSYINNLLENRQKDETVKFEVDKENSDFSCYNNNNSRRIKIKSIYLKSLDSNHLILDRRQYNGNISFIMKKSKLNCDNLFTIESKPITYKCYNELLEAKAIEKIIDNDVLYFINHGNYFSLVEDNYGMNLCVNLSDICEVPKNIVLKKGKPFIK